MNTQVGVSRLTASLRAMVAGAGALAMSAALAAPIDAGFEDDTIGLPPGDPWQVEVADALVVVGSEGPADFPVYAERGITVTPFLGNQAVRFGRPKDVSESQTSGPNRISQTFASTSATLRFSLYLFSFEHRGDDSVGISVQDASGTEFNAGIRRLGETDLTIDNPPRGVSVSCQQTPCVLPLDVGKRNDFLDTGWMEIELSGLPDDGSAITLSINIQGAENEAHPTWGYFDNANTPPVATFSFNPGRAGPAGEGDFIVADASSSSDPDGDALTYTWVATGGGLPGPASTSGSSALFVFPDAPNGNPQITLTVSDGTTTATAQTGDGSIPAIDLNNVPPFIAALDAEVLSAGTTELTCRFLDPGVLDSHSGDLSVTDGSLLLLPLQEENDAPFSSGTLRGTFTAPALGSGEFVRQITGNVCAITDDVATSTDEFEIRVFDREEIVNRFEPNDSTSDAAILRAGSSYLGALESQDDLDVFEIRLANGDPLPVKSQVSVRLSVPADFDLIGLGRSSSTLAGSPLLASPLLASPWLASPLLASPILASPILASPLLASDVESVPLLASPLLASPWLASPLLASPILASPILASGLALTQFPLQQIAGATPDGSNISATDTSWLEVGSLVAGDLANENIEIKALSAEPATNPEHVYMEVGPGDEAIFVAVTGTNGAFASTPYTITVEVAEPFKQADLLGAGQCTRSEPLVPAGIGERMLTFASGAPTSLVVVQYERFAATWDLEESAEAFFAQMAGYLSHPAVNANVLLLGSDMFVGGDLAPCSVAAQNEVASAIRSRIQQHLADTGSIENIVLIGGYDVLPPYYVIDESIVTYEGLYGADLWIQPNTHLSAAINEGYNPTDAYYASSTPLPYRGRQLFVKDTPIGRLLETPQQVLATAQAFVDNDGLIPSLSALAMGYDFFNDGTDETADVLESFATTRRLTTDGAAPEDAWNAETLRCEYLAIETTAGETCTIADVRAVNAHMSYNLAAPAFEYAANNFLQNPDGLVRATEAEGKLNGGVDISIGCHSALNVPNGWALPGNGFPADPSFDWSEAGIRVGPLGFGSGDTQVANRGTEGLATLVVEELARGHSLGRAEVIAVQRYLNGLFEIDVHDEDAVITFNLNGPPQARLANPAAAAAAVAAQTAAAAAAAPYGTLTLDISRDGTPLPITPHVIEQVAVTNGVYYTADGEAQAIMGRPLLPVVTPPGFDFVDVSTMPDADWLHGVLLLGGNYEDLLDLDPVISSRAQDWARAVRELQICVETRTPTQLAAVSTLRAGNDVHQSLIVNPGQFECTLTPEQQRDGDIVIGNFRIFDNLVFDALSPPADAPDTVLEDFTPPAVGRQDITASVATTDVTAELSAEDPNGVRTMVGLVYNDDDGLPGGTGNVISVVADCGGAVNCERTLTLPDARGKLLAFQYADVAGNVVTKSLKGLLIEALEVNIRTRSFTTGDVTTIVIEIENFAQLENGILEIDYGDGTADVLALSELPLTDITPDGFGVIEVTHSYAGFAGTEVTVVATVRAAGAVGTDTETLTRPFDCDPIDAGINPDADIVACQFGSIGTEVTLDVYVAGTITDEFQYRLTLDSLSGLFKLNDLTKVSTPPGVSLLEPVLGGPANRVRFRFDAADLGWDGVSPLTYQWETQKGVKGQQSTGFVDETVILTGEP